MKFVCHNCQAKYSVSDDKVRNKRLKIRCKNCGTLIEVVDPTLAERLSSAPPGRFSVAPVDQVSIVPEKPTVSAAPAAAPASSLEQKFAGSFSLGSNMSPAPGTPGLLGNLKQSAAVMNKDVLDESVWFAALDNTPIGPVSARLIHQYKRFDRVLGDTLVWKEGMPDWAPLQSVPALTSLLAKIDAETAPPSKVSNAPAPKLALLGGTVAQNAAPLRGAHVGVLSERPVPKEEQPPSAAAPAAKASKSEGAEAAPRDMFEAVPTAPTWEPPQETSMVHSLSPPRAGSHRVYLLASVGFFVTALVTLTLVIFGGGRADGEPQTVRTVEKIVEKVVYRDREPNADSKAGIEKSDDARATSGTSPSNGSRGTRKSTTKKKAPESEDRTSELMERMGVSVPSNRPNLGGRSGGPSAVGNLPQSEGLSADQLKRVVNNNKGSLKNCYERSLKKGEAAENRDIRVNFKLTVGTSGTVKSVVLSGDGAKLDSLNGCLTQSVKRWVFPASGQQSNLEFPFVFTPTG